MFLSERPAACGGALLRQGGAARQPPGRQLRDLNLPASAHHTPAALCSPSPAMLPAASSQETEASISRAREVYRPVALRGSLLYFLVDSLGALDRVYHYSMANFVRTMVKGMVSQVEQERGKQCCPAAAVGGAVRWVLLRGLGELGSLQRPSQ